jgi:hypothetical protein
MQIAASNPQYVSMEQVPQEAVAKERSILEEQARQSGRPENVIARIVDGRMQKYFQEVCLLEQPFVKDPDRTVNDVLRIVSLNLVRIFQLPVLPVLYLVTHHSRINSRALPLTYRQPGVSYRKKDATLCRRSPIVVRF